MDFRTRMICKALMDAKKRKWIIPDMKAITSTILLKLSPRPSFYVLHSYNPLYLQTVYSDGYRRIWPYSDKTFIPLMPRLMKVGSDWILFLSNIHNLMLFTILTFLKNFIGRHISPISNRNICIFFYKAFHYFVPDFIICPSGKSFYSIAKEKKIFN